MFSAIPRPKTAALIRAALRARSADMRMPDDLWRPKDQSGDRDGTVHWLSRGAWAMERTAALTGKPAPLVWLPDYFCHGSEHALRQSGARIAYYPVTEGMTPDWSACRDMAGAAPPDMFVLVHTFGVENDTGGARAFADEHGALLLEDAAHVLRPAGSIGQAGDAVFFSPHKWLALPDGAVLHLRAGLDYMPPPGPRARARGWFVEHFIESLTPAALQPKPVSRGPQRFFDDSVPSAKPPPPGVSALSCALLSGLDEPALDKITERRRVNWRAWADSLNPRAGLSMLEGADIPYRCVIDAGRPEQAEALFNALRRAGVPAKSWPETPPAVLAAPERHAAAVALRRRLVLLPVHQDIEPRAIHRAAAALPEFFDGRGVSTDGAAAAHA